LREPAKNLLFHERWRLIEPGHVRIERGGQHVRHHGERRAGALYPTPETRVIVAGRVRTNPPHKFRIRRFGTVRLLGERFGERVADVVRHGLPDGTVVAGSEVIDGVVEHAASQGTKFFPVARVEGLFGSLSFCAHAWSYKMAISQVTRGRETHLSALRRQTEGT